MRIHNKYILMQRVSTSHEANQEAAVHDELFTYSCLSKFYTVAIDKPPYAIAIIKLLRILQRILIVARWYCRNTV